ncbi:Protein MRPL-53 [Aphelenchoides avenae]|nr:Protein MRPL-53 [Aphelenchus avenae]
MCKMWERIRWGVRWTPLERQRLAARALNLKPVKSILVSFDPFFKDNVALRTFWFDIQGPRIKATNPKLRVKSEIRNDRQPPFFRAELEDGRSLLFKTAGMHPMDVHMRFNKLLGNPVLGPSGPKRPPQPA